MNMAKFIPTMGLLLCGMVAIAGEKATVPAFAADRASPKVVRVPDEKTAAPRRRSPVASVTRKNPLSVTGRISSAQSGNSKQVSFTVYGTWNALQAITTIIGQYENSRHSHGIQFMPLDSDQIAAMLSRRRCDVGIPFNSFVPKVDEKVLGQYESFPLGRFVIAVAVNATNPVRAMSVSDLQRVFSMRLMIAPAVWKDMSTPGTIMPMDVNHLVTTPAMWKDISGSNNTMPIELYRPNKFGPEGWFVQKRILSGGPFADECSRESIAQHQKKSDAEIIAAIAKQANAIGFFRYPFDKLKEKRIRILGISKDADSSPVFPSASTLADGVGAYPLADTLTVYLHPDAPEEAKEFCRFASGPAGAKIVRQCGFWPEYELKELRAKQHLIAAKRGKGELIAVCDLTGSGQLLKDLGQEFVKVKAAVQLSIESEDGVEGPSLALTPEQAGQELRGRGSDLLLAVRTPTRSEGQNVEVVTKKAALTPTLAKRPGEKAAADKGQPSHESLVPRPVVLGWMAVGVIVHPKNLLDSLPLTELQGIFCGEIKQWPAANGVAGPMHVHGLHHTDPVSQLLQEKLPTKLMSLKHTPEADNAKVVLEVAKDPFAIGFVDLSQLSPDEKSIKLVNVYLPGQSKQIKASMKDAEAEDGGRKAEKTTGGKSPTPRLSSLAVYHLPEDYPLVRTFTLYVSPKASETAKDFAQFVASDRCATTLLKHNLLPALYSRADRGTPEPEKPKKPYLGNRR